MIFDINKLYEENLKEFEEIDNIINNEGVSLFGAGGYGNFASMFLLKNNYKLHYFIDNDYKKINTYMNGIKILKKDDSLLKQYKVILISAHHKIDEIKNSICQKHYSMSFDKWFTMKYFYEITKVKNYFEDIRSKDVFDVLLYAKLSENINFCSQSYDDNQYFSINQFKYKNGNEIFLDAGAYVGDTIEKFLYNNYGLFKKIYAFEPGKKQVNAMKTRLKRIASEWSIDLNNIYFIKAGLSKNTSTFYINNDVAISSYNITNEKKGKKIKVYSIDDFLNGEPITFLKSDIEGEELNMLKGAENTIKKYKPKMAISVYHRPDDLFSIFEYIKKLVPEYAFFLRHHSISFDETVLYCWVDKQ